MAKVFNKNAELLDMNTDVHQFTKLLALSVFSLLINGCYYSASLTEVDPTPNVPVSLNFGFNLNYKLDTTSLYSSFAIKIAKDSFGNLYSLGSMGDPTGSSSVQPIVLRKSTDGGNTWYTILESVNINPTDILITPTDEIFITTSENSSPNKVWRVRKSTDYGVSFNVVDEFLVAGYYNAWANSIARNNAGAIFVVGGAYKGCYSSSNCTSWFVRRSLDSGATWAQVDEYRKNSGYRSEAYGITVTTDQTVYVGGNGEGGASMASVVRKSTDGGNTWSVSDSYGTTTWLRGITSIGNQVFIALNNNAIISAWVVRTTTDGVTWSNSTNFALAAGKTSSALGICASSADGIYSFGIAADNSNVYYSTIIKSTDLGATWTTASSLNTTLATTPYYKNCSLIGGDLFLSGYTSIPNTTSDRNYKLYKSDLNLSNINEIDSYNWIIGRSSGGMSVSMANNEIYSYGNSSRGPPFNDTIYYIKKSSDAGQSWSDVSTTGQDISGSRLVAYQNYFFIASVVLNGGTGNYDLAIKRSSNGGQTFTTIDQYSIGGFYTVIAALKIRNDGKIFVLARMYDASFQLHLILRTSSDYGSTWTTKDFGYNVSSADIDFGPNNEIYVVAGLQPSSVYYWRVYKSTDEGSTWNTVDDFSLVATFNSTPRQISVNQLGHIYVSGFGTDASSSSHVLVRKSIDGGVSWYTVYDENRNALSTNTPLILADSYRIYLSYSKANSDSSSSWSTYVSTNQGSSWVLVDQIDSSNNLNYNSPTQMIFCNGLTLCLSGSYTPSFKLYSSWVVKVLQIQ